MSDGLEELIEWARESASECRKYVKECDSEVNKAAYRGKAAAYNTMAIRIDELAEEQENKRAGSYRDYDE